MAGRANQLTCPVCRAKIRFVVPSYALRSLAADAEAAARNQPQPITPAPPAPNPLEAAPNVPGGVGSGNGSGSGGGAEGQSASDEARGIDSALEEYNQRWEGTGRAVVQSLSFAGRLRSGFVALPLLTQIVIVLICLAAIGYVLSPFDLLPESALGLFGLVDDLLVLILTVILIGVYYRAAWIRLNARRYA